MKDVVFVHGWGYDGSVWEEVIPHVRNVNAHVLDLGFTGNEVKADLPERAVYVGHSLGVMWSLKYGRNVQALVSIAGFDCFGRYVPAAALQSMHANLKRNLAAQMRGFDAACGIKRTLPSFNTEKLAEGLRWLTEWDEEEACRQLRVPVVALAAEDDVIFPLKASRQVWGDRLVTQATGGHALPLTQGRWCASSIQKVVDESL